MQAAINPRQDSDIENFSTRRNCDYFHKQNIGETNVHKMLMMVGNNVLGV